MAKQTTNRLVHCYDIQRHRILCATRTADDHSTKHLREVTCSDCIALLRERAVGGASSSGVAASSA